MGALVGCVIVQAKASGVYKCAVVAVHDTAAGWPNIHNKNNLSVSTEAKPQHALYEISLNQSFLIPSKDCDCKEETFSIFNVNDSEK